jgi:hypothetical protein
MAITGNSFLHGFTETVFAINDTVRSRVLEIFLLGLANWVTGFGRQSRSVESAKALASL